MTRIPKIIRPLPARGRPADRLATLWSGIGLVAACLATLWFFAGFFETDPNPSAASSALLLSLLLGAFAIIPCAVVMRLAWSAWRSGFRTVQGLWTILLFAPWLGLAHVAAKSDWLPGLLSLGPALVATPVILWAMVSLWLEHRPGRNR